jgi:hypothetical protein
VVALALTKAAAGTFLVGYMGGTYHLTVSNVGTLSTSAPIICTDPLPAGLSYVSSAGDGWTCAERDRTITCTYPLPLPPGHSTRLTLYVSVTAQAMPEIENVAFAETAGDRSPSTASAVTAVAAAAPAPALSALGLAMAVGGLLAIAWVAFGRRRHGSQSVDAKRSPPAYNTPRCGRRSGDG